jgi:hypothetical protein
MNAALFPIDYPDKEALIGDSTILAVNDCRYGYYTTIKQYNTVYM